jgi:ABC-type glycerol-3-phosphate transport system substrate-binding protein
MLVNAGFQRSPTTWSEIPIFAKKVLELNKDGNLSQRGIALGSLNNITYGKEILNSLLLQVKNDVFQRKVTQTDEGFSEDYFSVFGSNKEDEENQNGKVAEQVFVFFSSFVNPNLDVYSWSKKYSNDRELFAAGNLGIYFGLSGDRAYIDSKNPHIRYEIAPIPIPKGGEGSMRNTGYAKVYGLSMNSKTKKMPLAQKVLNDFLEGNIMKDIVQVYSLAPSKISQITIEQTEKFRDTVYKSADRADIILEEKPDVLKTIFQEILTSLEGSKVTPAQIIVNSQRELQRILEE